MDEIYMVIGLIVMPILSVLFAEWRLKRATSNVIEDTIENLKTDAINTLSKPETAQFIQNIGAQLAAGMASGAGKEIKGAIPKFKMMDIIGLMAMKYLGGGNMGGLLGMGGGEGQPEGSNTSNVRSRLEE